MASAGSNANANAAQRFWNYFQDQKRTIDGKIASNQDVSQLVRDLDISLREALVYLPPYDQKQLSRDLESLRAAVQQQGKRAAGGGKPGGFKFKSARTTKLSIEKVQEDTNNPTPLQSVTDTTVSTNKKQADVVTSGSVDSSFVFTNITDEWKTVSGVPQQTEEGETGGQQTDCELRDIASSIIDLRQVSDSLRALNCHRLRNSIVLCGPFAGSATIRNSVNCILVLAVRQMRLENSTHIDTYLHCSSRPIIEKSSAIRFAPYPPQSLAIQSRSSAAGNELLELPNMYANVDDFNWLKRQHSPNWSINLLPLDSAVWEADPLLAAKDALLKLLPQQNK
ncbi:hypothetical protein EV175_001368 [Coemansia sp. RSA 1933]|nr:hypothetical protein EV175_001368 [Coemansia sp. RSA 1933]